MSGLATGLAKEAAQALMCEPAQALAPMPPWSGPGASPAGGAMCSSGGGASNSMSGKGGSGDGNGTASDVSGGAESSGPSEQSPSPPSDESGNNAKTNSQCVGPSESADEYEQTKALYSEAAEWERQHRHEPPIFRDENGRPVSNTAHNYLQYGLRRQLDDDVIRNDPSLVNAHYFAKGKEWMDIWEGLLGNGFGADVMEAASKAANGAYARLKMLCRLLGLTDVPGWSGDSKPASAPLPSHEAWFNAGLESARVDGTFPSRENIARRTSNRRGRDGL